MSNWQSYPSVGDKNSDDFHGAIEMAPILSRNGAYGCVWLIKCLDGYYLQAGGNDTGRLWKSPDELFDSIDEAKDVAEKTWTMI